MMNRTINKAYINVALAMGIAELDVALLGTKLDPQTWPQLEALDVADVVTIVNTVVRLSNNPVWPAQLGEQLGATSHGPIGFATLSAPDVETAVRTFTEFFVLRCNTYHASITADTEYATIRIDDTTFDTVFANVFFIALARAIEVILAQIIGALPKGKTAVRLKLSAEDIQPLQSSFHSTLLSDAEHNSLSIPINIWEQASMLSDPANYSLNYQKCQELKLREAQTTRMTDRVEQLLQAHFETAATQPENLEPPPSVPEICKALYVTERTFYRKLKHEGTSYKALLQRNRFEKAQQLLNKGLNTQNIARVLGYQESANFCRAFKAWSGYSPTSYRQAYPDKHSRILGNAV